LGRDGKFQPFVTATIRTTLYQIYNNVFNVHVTWCSPDMSPTLVFYEIIMNLRGRDPMVVGYTIYYICTSTISAYQLL